MSVSRREILTSTALAAAGCIAPKSPMIVRRSERRVLQTIDAFHTLEGAGTPVRRLLGQRALRNLDPFILLDHFHIEGGNEPIPGFPTHPHRGFETVTVMLNGMVRHQDSRGNSGTITAGGIQWMTAGRGILHSEMPDRVDGLLSGFQLWVNLPAQEKMSRQYYQEFAARQIPEQSLTAHGSVLRVIAGNVHGLSGAIRPRPTQPTLFTLTLNDEQLFSWDVPTDHNAFIAIHSGAAMIGDTSRISEGQLAVLSPGNRVTLRAQTQGTRLLFAAGAPIREPIVQRGPFVMNTEAEIEQAFRDYRAGVLDQG